MTKLIASFAALAVVAVALPAMACPFQDQTAQSKPVVTSDATTSAPMTPAPPKTPVPPTTTKTGS
jgi:hypothetical protein